MPESRSLYARYELPLGTLGSGSTRYSLQPWKREGGREGGRERGREGGRVIKYSHESTFVCVIKYMRVHLYALLSTVRPCVCMCVSLSVCTCCVRVCMYVRMHACTRACMCTCESMYVRTRDTKHRISLRITCMHIHAPARVRMCGYMHKRARSRKSLECRSRI